MAGIAFEKHTLPNGLDVILHQDRSIPVAAVNVWYHVGSKDEEIGRTGFAHLFEHIMFRGTRHHKASHFEPLQKIGASLNGSTTGDRTNYWEDVPSNYLELALWLEADRMGFLLDALDQDGFDTERDVVKNERRQSYENRPYGMAQWHIQRSLFPLPHPYHWMTIGSQEDLDAASLDDVMDFFRRYYSPSNASLAIAGDIDTTEALDLAHRYFADLDPGPSVRRIERADSLLSGRVDLEMTDRVTLPRIYAAWLAPANFSGDDDAGDILRAILSDGQSSRMYRTLVYEKQIAQSATVGYHAAEIAGQFRMELTPAEGHTLDEVEEAAEAVLAGIAVDPPTEEEFERAVNRIEMQHQRMLSRVGGFGGRADALNYFNVFAGDPDGLNRVMDQYRRVTLDDVLKAHSQIMEAGQVRMRVYPERALSTATVALDRTQRPDGGPTPAFVPPVPERTRIANGMEVIVVGKRGTPLVTFALLARTGAIGDPAGLPGLTSFMAAMMDEGTANRSSQEIAAAFEHIGSRLAVEARKEITLLTAETLSRHWRHALGLAADVARNANFPEHELDRVRRERLTDLRRARDDAGFVAESNFGALVFGPDSPYAHSNLGNEATVSAASRDDLVAQYGQALQPDRLCLLVAGDVSLQEAVAAAEECFGDWSPTTDGANGVSVANDAAVSGPRLFLIDKPGAAQSVIRAGMPLVERRDADHMPLSVLNYAFGGQFSARLNQNLRQDKGYSYGYNSGISWYNAPSLLSAGGSVQTEVTREAVVETLREFEDISGGRPLSVEELENAQNGLRLGYPSGFERPAQLLGQLIPLVQFDLPTDYFRTFEQRLSAVSLTDTHRVGAKYLTADRLRVLVVGDRARVEEPLRNLGYGLTVLDAEGTVAG
ncbi:MAG: pitrilysin family protein [Chloroflexota bacterium]|nr:pitrilysin family protein [Chloroflexota bacterium]MDE2960467.1 pitrilysin family protein [Chloroflexota bacterium]